MHRKVEACAKLVHRLNGFEPLPGLLVERRVVVGEQVGIGLVVRASDAAAELVLESAGEARVESGAITEDDLTARADYSASPDDNAIIEGVTADPGGLGWVGFAFADQAEGVRLMPVSEEPGGECVEPNAETIQDGTYPIARDLFIYVNKAKAEENAALAAFVDFYLEGLTGFVEAADYIPLADAAETESAWADRTAGTREG